VGFRAFVWRNAAELGVSGWVRNRLDGSVEVLAAASEAVLDELERRLRTGPRWARVDALQVEHETVEQPPAGFAVLPDC
jgi:acylphosphatase